MGEQEEGKIRAICEYCLYYKKIEPNVGVVKWNYGVEGDEKKVDEWIKKHKESCDGNIVLDFPDKKTSID